MGHFFRTLAGTGGQQQHPVMFELMLRPSLGAGPMVALNGLFLLLLVWSGLVWSLLKSGSASNLVGLASLSPP